LPRFYLEQSGILAEKLTWDGTTYTAGAPSVRGTANVLLALFRLRSRNVPVPLDPDRMLDRCVDDHLERSGFPEIALLLWADAIGSKRHLPRLWAELQRRLPRSASSTMLLSWTLSGVSEYFKAGGERRATEDVARRLYDTITRNQFPRTGLFFASADRQGLLRRRKPTAFLASQVFAIQALAQYSESFGVGPAVGPAVKCADRLCGLQGDRGQWWREYHVREGTVADEYPVYSVNQDGAVPTALHRIGRVARDHGFEKASDLGLRWLFGDNELNAPMLDEERAVVLAGLRREGGDFEIMREMPSYHAGRCLYALSLSDSV
jgi:hypothetical protein